MPNLNPRKPGDLPYPNRSVTTNLDLNVGGLLTVPITTPGTGYTIGEQVSITAPPSGGIQAQAEIETVNGSGGILTVKITNPGAGYTAAPTITDPVPTTGTGAAYGTATISALVPIDLGKLYSTDAAGRLILPPVATSIGDFRRGIFQARASTVPGDGFTKVQVVAPITRVILFADPNLRVGEKVDLKILTATTGQYDKVQTGTTGYVQSYVGRIFEIETKNADGSKKEITADNDLVIVDMGVSQ